MSAAAKKENRPFAMQLEVEFLDRISEPVREGRVKSVSELIRAALEQFDFSRVVVVRPANLLISVRLPAAIRGELKRLSRAKHTSVGQLVRTAVESYLPRLESAAAGQLEMPIATAAAAASSEFPGVLKQPGAPAVRNWKSKRQPRAARKKPLPSKANAKNAAAPRPVKGPVKKRPRAKR